jgi:alkylation response protein AidB-like acyl-CoA dehydrogenase
MTTEYLRTREQFGVKIGSFQALQHRAVEMFVETELLRSHALEAALRIDEGDATDRRAAVSSAKAALSTSGRAVVKQAIQLHGGIGITDEHDVGLYFKRMQVLSTLFGDEAHHLARLASLEGFAP